MAKTICTDGDHLSSRCGHCQYCGSSKHGEAHCNIYLKVQLLEQGVSAFDETIVASSLEDAAEQVSQLRRGATG